MTILLDPRLPGTSPEEAAADLRARLPDAEVLAAEDEEKLEQYVPRAEVFVTGAPPGELLGAAGNLRWIQALSAGVDGYDREALESNGVALTNASGVHGAGIAQQVVGYLLFFERRFDRAVAQQRRREWERYEAGELGDRTIGIVGTGAIGSTIAEYCTTFGPEILGVKRDPSRAPEALDAVYTPDELDTVLKRSDYLVLTCPLTEDTWGLIDAEALATLSEDAVVVNVARGEVIDQPALVEALEADELRGAALDVFEEEPLPGESPLWSMDRVLVTPHVAGLTPHYWERFADLFERNYERFVAGDPLENRIV